MESKRHGVLKIVTGGDPIEPTSGLAGLLFQCAPDSGIIDAYPNHLDLRELIGDVDAAKARAFRLARKLLEYEPPFRGIRQLNIFEEVVIRELQYAFHLIHLYHAVVKQGVVGCRFDSPSRWAEGLRAVARICGGSVKVESPPRRAGSLARSLRRLASSGFSLQSLREESWQAMARIDPYRRRSRPPRPFRLQGPERGKWWFYSTAYTFTRIGLDYEPYFPERFSFLIANPLTGGKALGEAGRSSVCLYDFGAKELEPSGKEISAAASEIERHIRNVSLSGDELVARTILAEGRWFAEFLRRLLPQGLYQSALLDRWIESANPAALVVGNPVFEAYALHAARRNGVPTILLQHGILGDYRQFVDPPVDHYVVRGQFWRDFLSPAAQAKAVVLNPPGNDDPAGAPKVPLPAETKHILFITASYDPEECVHPANLEDIVLVLLRASAATGASLVVRVHPLEQVAFYRSLAARLRKTHDLAGNVVFSQGPGLEEVVAGAAVAITFASTVFLDCLRLGVPIIGLGWHDFSYRKKLDAHSVFFFAESLGDLEHLVREGIAGRLQTDSSRIGDFLAPTDAGTLTTYFGTLLTETPQRRHVE